MAKRRSQRQPAFKEREPQPNSRQTRWFEKRKVFIAAYAASVAVIAGGIAVAFSVKEDRIEEQLKEEKDRFRQAAGPKAAPPLAVSKILANTARDLKFNKPERLSVGVLDITSYRSGTDTRQLDRKDIKSLYQYVLDINKHEDEIPLRYFGFVDSLKGVSGRIRSHEQSPVSIGMLYLPPDREDLCIGSPSPQAGPSVIAQADKYPGLCAPDNTVDINVTYNPALPTDIAVLFDQDPGPAAEAHALVHAFGAVAGNRGGETPEEHQFANFIARQIK